MAKNADIGGNEYLDERGLEQHYGISPRTAQRWRKQGKGPSFVRRGERKIVYRVADIEAWLAGRTYKSIADELSRKAA